MENGSIDNIREEIDQIDEQLMNLINQRAQLSKQIGVLKESQNLEVLQLNRENFVLDHIKGLATEISPENAGHIWKELMAACRSVQGENYRVAFFGAEGSNAHLAARQFFSHSNTEFLSYERTHEVFQQVEGNYVDFGIVPVENSLNGSVGETLDLLIERNVRIYGEIELRVVHNLIGLSNTDLKELKTVYSHPQALAQVNEWIRKNIPQVELYETNSTSRAVQKVAEMGDPTAAAIGSELAAELSGLDLLAQGIEDNTQNFTRFLVISNNEPAPSGNDKTFYGLCCEARSWGII